MSLRKFRIGSISQPKLFVTLDFDKNAYVAGDAVTGKVKVRNPDGEKLPIGSSIGFDVETTKQSNITLDSQGEATINFNVPANTSNKVLSVSVSSYLGYSQVDNSSAPSVSVHSVPLQDDDFDVLFFPEFTNEGLIEDAHAPNRIYF